MLILTRLSSGQDSSFQKARKHHKKVDRIRKPVIGLSFGSPYVLRLEPEIGHIYARFSYADVSQLPRQSAVRRNPNFPDACRFRFLDGKNSATDCRFQSLIMTLIFGQTGSARLFRICRRRRMSPLIIAEKKHLRHQRSFAVPNGVF